MANKRPCGCGCGQMTASQFVRNHNKRIPLDSYVVSDEGFEKPCWLWPGGLTSDGYARIARDGVRHLAHRFFYEREYGPIADGMEIDHLCSVRNCVNPAHLQEVTPTENKRRAASFARNRGVALGMLVARITTGLTVDDIAEMFGSTYAGASNVLYGQAWCS